MLLLSPILRDRKFALAISGTGLLQAVTAVLGISLWQCPIFHLLGIPCPGCGMTRAAGSLLHGKWEQSLSFHAFAPVFVIALALVTCTALSPKRFRSHIIGMTESLERHTGITTLLLLGLIVYWLARLLILRSDFVRLIQG
jgi:hypothetical protein